MVDKGGMTAKPEIVLASEAGSKPVIVSGNLNLKTYHLSIGCRAINQRNDSISLNLNQSNTRFRLAGNRG